MLNFQFPDLVKKTGRLLRARRETLSVAESCTGGLLSETITRVPGSSGFFLQGCITYHNDSKVKLLGVRKGTLAKHGAVSKQCAEEMAQGSLQKAGSDWALAITGIAGPGGGSNSKPVGLVYVALAGPGRVVGRKLLLKGSRRHIRSQSVRYAIQWLCSHLKK